MLMPARVDKGGQRITDHWRIRRSHQEMKVKRILKRPTFVGSPYLVAMLPLILAACSKPVSTSDVAAPASAVSNTVEALSEPSASAPSPAVSSVSATSDPGANPKGEDEDADAQEADESGAPVGTVMKADVSSDGSMTTPFGKLTVSADNALMLDGKAVNPRVEGNNSLSFVAQVALKNRRAVLVQNNGGTACPATYQWVIVSDGGNTVSPDFGSCSDLAKVSTASGVLVVTMPGFAGDAEPAAERKRAARKRMTYAYDGKTLTENGKPVSAP
ncbi:hypothetical protein ACS0X5_11790 [Burkholderia gladioli]|uniref:hypothetical protein n=1 Tax=Burkholderia gladioli TaxID=28095 RepID=UPI003F78C7EE